MTNQTTTDLSPNLQQAELIETIQGPVLVDAGAGTGKTFTIAKRYLHILEHEHLQPRDILLLTFTRNAAEEMRERILHLGQDTLSPADLREAPISTFHALARRLLQNHGFNAPTHLGLEIPIPPTFTLIEDPVRERELFEDFLRTFRRDNPEHAHHLRTLYDPTNLLDLIRELAAKGIFPTQTGWYRDGERVLQGDRAAFLDAFDEANATDGSKQSDARRRLNDYDKKLTLPHAPTEEQIRGPPFAAKQVDPAYAKQAFDDDREPLFEFIHDIYYAYLAYALDRSYLNFQFLLLFAYVLLVENHTLRKELSYDYVTIDEFQDTSEIQLQLALLFCNEPNLCCVGDWKQSIYSFQYASVENITHFTPRVTRYANQLNQDHDRVPPADTLTPPHTIPLNVNYRSTQPILDTSLSALTTPGTHSETLNEDTIQASITPLESTAQLSTTRLQKLETENEVDAVLAKLQDIHHNPDYPLLDEDESTTNTPIPREPTYSDIAILTRTRAFALELEERAREIGLPIAFEGGVDVYATDPGKLLLAWLRLLENPHNRKGWALILDAAGYPLHEAQHILNERDYPEDMQAFRRALLKLRHDASPGAIARAIFDKYGLDNGFTHALTGALQTAHETTRKTPSELVQVLEDRLNARATEGVDEHPGGDVATVQTIHAAKGLEYPIVILADVNQQRFPSTGGGAPSTIRFNETTGLRATKTYAEPDDKPPYIYDKWEHQLLKTVTGGRNYDEERRLLYVALSRAEQHLVLTATNDNASPFFTELPIDAEPYQATPQPETPDPTDQPPPLQIEPPTHHAPIGIPISDLLPDHEERLEGGRGRRFGEKLHEYAAQTLQQATPRDPRNQDEQHVQTLIQTLQQDYHTLEAEVPCRLPVPLDDTRYILEGKIDLLASNPTTIRIIDWKTTPPNERLNTYQRQLGLYAAIVQQAHPDKHVQGTIVYTQDATQHTVDPLPLDQIQALIQETQAHPQPPTP